MTQLSPEDKNWYGDKIKQKQIIPLIEIEVIVSVFYGDTNSSVLRQEPQNNADYCVALGEVAYALFSSRK